MTAVATQWLITRRRALALVAGLALFAAGASAASAAGTPAPTDVTAPTMSGTLEQGQTLSASHGYWDNSPTSYTDAWQRCDASGANCADISGATGSTYVLAAGDVGHELRVQEYATNAGGTGGPAYSSTTGVVLTPTSSGYPPVSLSAPTLTGKARVAKAILCTDGSWTGTSPITVHFTWLRDGAPIAGADSASYTIQASDAGHRLSCRVRAVNSSGSTYAVGAGVRVPIPRAGVLTIDHVYPGGNGVVVRFTCSGRPGAICGPTLALKGFGSEQFTLVAFRRINLGIVLNARGRRLLAKRRKLPVTLVVSGNGVRHKQSLVFRG